MPHYRLKAEGAAFGAEVPKAPKPEQNDTLSGGRSTDDEAKAKAEAKVENPDA